MILSPTDSRLSRHGHGDLETRGGRVQPWWTVLEIDSEDALLGVNVRPAAEGYAHMADNFIREAARVGLFGDHPGGTR